MFIYDLIFIGICAVHVVAMCTLLVLAKPGPKQ